MTKKSGVILTIVLAVILAVFLYCEDKAAREKEAYYTKKEELLAPLNKEKRQWKEQLSRLENDHHSRMAGHGSAVILFTGCDERIYTEIYPIMQEYGYAGVLEVSEEHFPGEEGSISQEQLRELSDAGWTTCVRWEGVPTGEGWLYRLTNRMKEAGIARGNVMYFPYGTYEDEQDRILKELGFDIAVHHGEMGKPLIVTEAKEEIWHPGAVGIKGESPRYKLQDAVAARGNIVFVVGYEAEDEMYDERAFRSMLDNFAAYQKENEFQIMDFQGARNYREGVEAGGEALTEVYEKERAEIEEKLKAIEQEMDNINKKYHKY